MSVTITGSSDNISASSGTLTIPSTQSVSAGSTSAPSISPSGDSNTGIFFPSADTIAFAEGGAEAARIDSSGNLGIGTISPLTKFDSRGTVLVATNSNGNNTLAFGDSRSFGPLSGAPDGSHGSSFIIGNSSTATGAPSYLSFWTTASGIVGERARIDTSGRLLVGLTTSSATSKLAVVGSVGDTPGFFQLSPTSDPSDGGYLGGLLFTGTEYTKPSAYIIASRNGANWSSTSKPGALTFWTTADAATSPTERMRIGSSGLVSALSIYNTTTATAANVNVDGSGALIRSTSSAKYKTDIETLDSSYADALLECRPVWYRSTCEKDNPNWGWWGFIAEEVAEIDPRLVHWKTVEVTYDENGSAIETPLETPEPEGVQYDRFVPHLLNLIKRQKEQIEAMEARLTALETK